MKYSSDDQRFWVEFETLPALVPQLLNTKFEKGFDRWRGAASLRDFVLQTPWSLKLFVDPEEFDGKDLSGSYTIPLAHDEKITILDGASVPAPWLVSFLSFGVLRPVGVMLTASIVHDFAFKHGVLLREREGSQELENVTIARHQADRLFGRMIATVNRMPVVGFVGWLAVRLGWLFVPYGKNQDRRHKPVPWGAFAVLLAVLAFLVAALAALGPLLLISLVSGGYMLGYLLLALVGPPKRETDGPGQGAAASDGG
ncbi:DUF1353 domain-containing protein [Cyanobium sp. BSA11S]|uniref:DUF1353 domain-containing protein n=1 Tax=Cyanobium sp. BSA11S TaxID=3108224 RepID=UPI003D8194E9